MLYQRDIKLMTGQTVWSGIVRKERGQGNSAADTNAKQRKLDVTRLGEYTDTDLSSGRSPLIHHVRVWYHQGTQGIGARGVLCYQHGGGWRKARGSEYEHRGVPCFANQLHPAMYRLQFRDDTDMQPPLGARVMLYWIDMSISVSSEFNG
ncbi:hypothetical protein CBL_07489 [Carabus blaptoides fortunei]